MALRGGLSSYFDELAWSKHLGKFASGECSVNSLSSPVKAAGAHQLLGFPASVRSAWRVGVLAVSSRLGFGIHGLTLRRLEQGRAEAGPATERTENG